MELAIDYKEMFDSELLPKPFLRWAGGKTWLLKHIKTLVPKIDFDNYHEPFLGAASFFLFFNNGKNSYLSDLNGDLIDTYIQVRDNPEKIVSILKEQANTREFYYKIRSTKANDPVEKAAIFIYLNMFSFNGIYRVNRDGGYNVPYGYRKNVSLNEKNFYNVSRVLQGVDLFCGDFDVCRANIKEGDFVFLDPPYTVSHNNNGFIEYNQKIFSLDDQYRLKNLIDYIDNKKAYYLLTNAGHSVIREIFKNDNNKMFELNRKSLIGGKNAKRGSVSEYIFTNAI